MLLDLKNNSGEQIDTLKYQLYTNKLFLNMVIHDLRNPTSCVKNGLIQTSSKFTQILQLNDDN